MSSNVQIQHAFRGCCLVYLCNYLDDILIIQFIFMNKCIAQEQFVEFMKHTCFSPDGSIVLHVCGSAS